MNKYIFFLKNLSAVAVSQIGGKIVVFLMVPIYTTYLTTEEYGVFDFVNTVVMLALPLCTLEIQTAVTRFTIDQAYGKQNKILANVLFINIAGIFLFLMAVILNYYLNMSSILKQYSFETFFFFVVNSLYNILMEFARGKEKIKIASIISLITTLVIVLANVLFLVKLQMGLIGFFSAYVIGDFTGICLLICFIDGVKDVDYKYLSFVIQKKLISFSLPMVFNSLSWWLNGMVDRYVIIFFCGLAANGIYAVSFKMVSIFVVIQGIFSQAWVISGLKEYKQNKGVAFFKRIHDFYFMLLVMALYFLLFFLESIASILFAGDFYEAWKFVPFLMVASLFGALSGFLGVIFSAANKTKAFASTTIVGAVFNVILNILLVPHYGGMGAALSALISGGIVWISRMKISAQYIDVDWIDGKHILAIIIMIGLGITKIIDVSCVLKITIFLGAMVVLTFVFYDQYLLLYKRIVKNKKWFCD